MGVLNVTPDSFSDGGRFLDSSAAVAHAERMAHDGADVIDVGGESTRPGAAPVEAALEAARVVPVVEALAARVDVPISVDTSKPQVMRAAVAAGASMINDVRALRLRGALEAAAELAVPVCLMHMQGQPGTMQRSPRYVDVVVEVRDFLLARVEACRAAGIDPARLVLDPGFGFGKTTAHNLALLHGLDVLAGAGYPVLAGLSRKSMIDRLLGRAVEDRLAASIALALEAAARGARMVRVHDVLATRDAFDIVARVRGGGAAP